MGRKVIGMVIANIVILTILGLGYLFLYLIGWKVIALELTHYPVHVMKAYKIPGYGMEPAIKKGDRIFTVKYKEARIEPQRFDVVVFTVPNKPLSYIKRIIGLPGETLEIKDGKVLINGKELTSTLYYYNAGDFGKEGQKIQIPANYYYVMGDNSSNSSDSRYYGPISRDNIISKAIRLYWPIHRIKNIGK